MKHLIRVYKVLRCILQPQPGTRVCTILVYSLQCNYSNSFLFDDGSIRLKVPLFTYDNLKLRYSLNQTNCSGSLSKYHWCLHTLFGYYFPTWGRDSEEKNCAHVQCCFLELFYYKRWSRFLDIVENPEQVCLRRKNNL